VNLNSHVPVLVTVKGKCHVLSFFKIHRAKKYIQVNLGFMQLLFFHVRVTELIDLNSPMDDNGGRALLFI
jgi:hypothetical protein